MIKEFLKKHKIIVFIFLAIIFYLVFISIVITVLPKENNNFNNSVTPTPIFEETEKEPYHSDSLGVTKKESDAQVAPKQLGALIKILPYKNSMFELSYDYSNDSFLFLSSRSNTSQAELELSKLLNDYNLKKSDLTNLKSGFK